MGLPNCARVNCLIFFLGINFVGCSEQKLADADNLAALRMARIVDLAATQSEVESHTELLKAGQVFVNLEDWETPCIGVRVVVNDKGNRAFLSFTREWFDEHDDNSVATALLTDLAQALEAGKSEEVR